jgi:integrase
MGLASNISRRSGSARYYVRAWVPKELQGALKKKEIWKSLGTADPKIAKRLARQVLDQWERDFDALRAKRTLTDHELQTAIWNRYSELLRADELRRQSLPTEDDLDDLWQALAEEFGHDDFKAWRILEDIADQHAIDRQERLRRLAILKTDLAKGEIRSVAPVVHEIIKARDLDIEPRSPDQRKLAHGVQRAEIEALKRAQERDQGDFSGTPKDTLIKPPTATAPIVAAPGESIMELFDQFARQNPDAVTPDTLNQSRFVIDTFSQFVGRHFPVSKITRKVVSEWQDALFSYPVKATETAAFRDMDFRQIIATNRTLNRPIISRKTVNRYLASMGRFTKWLVAKGYLEYVPTTGLFLKIDKRTAKVHPYDIEQLKAIFASPLFTGCQADGKEHKPGNHVVRDHRFWLPLMSLYSGARLGELCQLLADDVRQMHGQWVFRITEQGDDDERLKTKGSERIVPVHSELIALGLIDHLNRARARTAKPKWLFPEIEPDARGDRAGNHSRFYGRYIKRIGIKNDRTLNFHSFRHGFADALRSAGFLDGEFAFLLGHTQNNVTGRYGKLTEGDLNRRMKLIEKVAYPGLDLRYIRTDL